VLLEVWREAAARRARIPDVARRLKDARSRLGAGRSTWGVGESVVAPRSDSLDDFDVDLRRRAFLEACILLEEFVKELASVVQAREMLAAIRAEPAWVR
jgi:hypothetical protein